MALVSAGWKLSVTLTDGGANTAVKQFDLTSADAAEALTDAAAILLRLGGVTDAVVKGYRLCLEYFEDALVYPAGVQVENRAEVVSYATNTLKPVTVEIPAPKIGLFVAATGPQSNIVDTADTDLIAFLQIFANGFFATISDGDTIETAALSGKRIHVASRKG